MKYFRWYRHLWSHYRGFFLFLVFMCLLDAVSTVAVPMTLKHLIDRLQKVVLESGISASEEALNLSLLLVGVGFFTALAHTFPFFRAWMNLNLEAFVRRKWFAMLLKKDGSFFLRHRTGDLITRLTDDLSRYPKVAWFGCSGIFRALNGFSIVLSCTLAMFYLHKGLTLVALLPIPIVFWAYSFLKDRLSLAWSENQRYISECTNTIETAVSGIRVIKSVNAEMREASHLNQILDTRAAVELRATKLSVWMTLFYEFASQAAQVLVVAFGGFLVISGELSIGGYYAFFTCLGIMIYPMLDLPNLLVISRQAFVCVDRLEELKGPESQVDLSAKAPEGSVHALGLNRATFFYRPEGLSGKSEEQPAVQDVSLEIRQGEMLAIIGRIGSGKSTLLSLLSGMQKPDSGQLLINEKPADEDSLKRLHANMGFIAQEPLVLSGTVKDNILFHRDFAVSRMEEASEEAQFQKDVSRFPEQFEQKIGQRGVTISGGQKQRLTIARALIGKPSILLMDDVTASLDASNEEGFWDAVLKQEQKPAMVVVTHRQATARRADRVLVLKDGRVEAYGTFDQLMESSPDFRELLEDEGDVDKKDLAQAS